MPRLFFFFFFRAATGGKKKAGLEVRGVQSEGIVYSQSPLAVEKWAETATLLLLRSARRWHHP